MRRLRSCATLACVPKCALVLPSHRASRFPAYVLLLLCFFPLVACASSGKRIVIQVDGERRVVDTQAVTVQDVLREQNISLGDSDRVDPPLFAEVARSATITVTRVQIKTEVEHRPIPFARRLVRDEFYPDGQLHVVQLGSNGMADITQTITIENGQETSRTEMSRSIIVQPKDEILALGTLGSLSTVPVTGTVAYIANGNAWVMRHSNGDKRPLTFTGDLDGRVFSLSPDGRYLLFSRAVEERSNLLNTLWLIDTLILGELPRALSFDDVLYAQLAPDVRAIAYSTGAKTVGAPGWKAHNDLWIAPMATGEAAVMLNAKQMIWKPGIPAPSSWWGTNFAWAPDGRAFAYAFANEIGYLELSNQPVTAIQNVAPRQTLKKFAPFMTRADWVWVPQVAWSPDSRFVIGVVHAPLDNPNVANDSPVFEVWALARDRSVNAPLAKQTGMWAAPVWSPPDDKRESKIAYGVALSPSDSERSRYALYVMDRDGGNKKQIFPQAKEDGLTVVQVAWSPIARQLIAVRENDLWLYDFATARWSQLTANGASSLPRWAK